MSFYHRYELVKLVNNGDPKSFEAREIQTGRPVLLHLWSMGGDSSNSPLLARMRSVMLSEPGLASGRLLEVQETAQPPYAVTVVEPGFSSLESWLDSLGTPPPPQPPATHAPPISVAGPTPADATVDMSVAAPHVFQPPPEPQVQPPPAPPRPDTSEFGRMFQGSISPPSVRPAPPQPQQDFFSSPPPQSQPAAEPGEFTRLFASPGSTPAVQPQATPPPAAPFGQQQQFQPPPSPSEPGEFTRLFASPAASAAPPQSPAPSPELAPPPPPVAPTSQPQPSFAPPPMPSAPPPGSGFTELFGGPVQPPSSPSAGAPQPVPAFGTPPQSYGIPQSSQAQPKESEFEKFFANPLGASPMPIEEIEQGRMAPPSPAPSAKPFRGPGEFTLQFGRDAVQQPSGPELSYSPPPTPQARMSSGATGLFSAPTPDYGQVQSGPAERSGPGEFTRIIQGPPKSGDSPAASGSPYSSPHPSAVEAPAPQRKSKLLPIAIALLSVVVIALVITVVVLVLKK